MELRSPENDTKSSVSSIYGHQSSSGAERRKDGNHNVTTVLSYTQTLDHRRQSPSSHGRSAPKPDRIFQTSSGSNSKLPGASANVKYRECLRNHAASAGGNIYDGCGEFMPGGQEGSLEALKCLACDCHRNFHRKEVDGETQFSPSSRRSAIMAPSLQVPAPLSSPTVQLHQRHHHQTYTMGLHPGPATANMVQPVSVAFHGSGEMESSGEDLNVYQSNAEGVTPLPPPPYALSKKRFRTKFTPEQKDKMMEFAEKVGWRINRQDEEELEKFCAEVGVKRQVFKVWMHNNKNLKKQQPEQDQPL